MRRELHRILLDRLGEAERIGWERLAWLVQRPGRKEAEGPKEGDLVAPSCFGRRRRLACGSASRRERSRLEGV